MLKLKEKNYKCNFCENFYGPCYDQPLCLTCHLFIFPNLTESQNLIHNTNSTQAANLLSKFNNSFSDNLNSSSDILSLSSSSSLIDIDLKFFGIYNQKLESNDSGNEDSDDNITNYKLCLQKTSPINFKQLNYNLINEFSKFDKNSNKLIKSEIYDRNINNFNLMNFELDYINKLPNEVLISIFLNLDDLSLWSASQVCKRWFDLIKQEINDDKWKTYLNERWIFCKPSIKCDNYHQLYTQLVKSSNCFYCLQEIHIRSKLVIGQEFKKSWRHKRLLLELKSFQQDPPDGIYAKPLDSSCYLWQASITGPVGSPYEGGIFYLYLKIPQSYPLNPPLVRFITKIYHPNISRHGDIGLDSIHENWSLALTISKVLISIQSLLTDPYTHVCMEKDIGILYKTNRDLYEKYAKIYTWKYAMNDYILFNCNQLTDYYQSILINEN